MENDFLWRRFERLGERIGDGDFDSEKERRQVNSEYNRLALLLIPELRISRQKRRKAVNTKRDNQIDEYLQKINCKCGGSLARVRSGSFIVICKNCNNHYRMLKGGR
jgi:hypothetical protein